MMAFVILTKSQLTSKPELGLENNSSTAYFYLTLNVPAGAAPKALDQNKSMCNIFETFPLNTHKHTHTSLSAYPHTSFWHLGNKTLTIQIHL